MPERRELESYIHVETLKALVVANWLNVNHIVKYTEEVTSLTMSIPNADGVITLRFNIEPDIQTI